MSSKKKKKKTNKGGVTGIGPVSDGGQYSRSLNNYNRSNRETVQQRFQRREAAGLDGLTGLPKVTPAQREQGVTQLTQYRDHQKTQIRNAAIARNAANVTGTPSGDKLKAGSFGISEAGQAEAAANRQEKAAADMAARSQNMFAAPNSNMFSAPSTGASNISASFASPAVRNFAATSFDKASSWYNKGRLPNEGKMSIRNLIRNDLTQQQQPKGGFVQGRRLNLASYARGESNPFRGMPGYGSITGQGQVEGGFQTGPTPSVRQAIERPLRTIGAGFNLLKNPKTAIVASLFKPTALADGTLQGKPTRFNTEAGGLNIGGSSAEASEGETTSGSRTGRTLGNRFLGGIDAIMRDTTDFDRRGVGNPASFGLENTVAGSVLNAAAQETGTINQFRKDTDNFSNLTNFNSLSNDEKVQTAQNVLKFTNDSQTAQALGEGLGLGKDFKAKINDAVDNVQGRLEGVTADRNSLYGVTSDFARDIGTDPDLKPINQFLTAAATNNLGEAGKEKNILGMTNEMARDIKAAFQDDSPTTEGLSNKERGIIGQFGNRILSGKATDGLREATYGYGGREGAVNAGLTEGQPLNFSDIQNTALAMKDNLGTDTTLASQRFDQAKRLVTPDGVTAGSLIRGVLPRFGNRTGSSGSTTTRGTGTTAPAAAVEELLIPQTPTYTAPTQTGTDSSNLQQIQQQSYMQNLAQLGITNLMQLPQFRTQQQRAPRRFRSFRRDYF